MLCSIYSAIETTGKHATLHKRALSCDDGGKRVGRKAHVYTFSSWLLLQWSVLSFFFLVVVCVMCVHNFVCNNIECLLYVQLMFV